MPEPVRVIDPLDCIYCGKELCNDLDWCNCDDNREFRQKHKLENRSDKEQDCGDPSCNYCRQVFPKTDILPGEQA